MRTTSSITEYITSRTCSRVVRSLVLTSAMISSVPGSCRASGSAETLAAFFVSTRALYSRPEGSEPRMLASTCTAANSGCGPEGT